MNKLFTKIATLTVGVTMAVGVGVALSVGSGASPVRAADAILAAGENSGAATINGKDAIKAGTAKKAGVATITIPEANATEVVFKIAAWKGDTVSVSVSASNAELSVTSIEPKADDVFTGTATAFTLENEADFEYKLELSGAAENEVITLTADTAAKCRFLVWDATYSLGEGGGSSTSEQPSTSESTSEPSQPTSESSQPTSESSQSTSEATSSSTMLHGIQVLRHSDL